jgi:hypothetical protein
VHPTALTVQPSDGIDAMKVVLAGQTADLMTSDIFVTWTGINPAKITPSSTSVDFDDAMAAVPGTAVLSIGSTKQITLTNPANSAPTGALSFRTDCNDFTIDLSSAKSSCFDTAAARPFNGLAPTPAAADSCTVTLIFRPTALATPVKTGNLIVTSPSGATAMVPLSGSALPSLSIAAHAKATDTEDILVATTAAADWCAWTGASSSAAAVCAYPPGNVSATAFASETVTVSLAPGAPPTGVLAVAVGGESGATPEQFKVVSDSCVGTSLSGTGSSASCKVTVRFAPRSTGNKSAVLSVWDPSSGTPMNGVSLRLTGAANP